MSEQATPAGGGPEDPSGVSALDLRRLTDPRDMRALAHPIRLALLEVLGVHGALTATQAGELIDESPASCSFHLRTLARHGFVEETGEGHGRQRPWRLVKTGLSIGDDPAESETFVAASALSQIITERQLGRLRQWWSRRRSADQAWIDAATQDEFITWLTPAELHEINDAVFEVLVRHRERLNDPSLRPEGSELVELLYFSYPATVGKPAQDPPTD